MADAKSAISQIGTSLKVICLVFLAPFKSPLRIWCLELYYDVSIVCFKCYATWNWLGFRNMWICVVIISKKYALSSDPASSPFSMASPPETGIRREGFSLCPPWRFVLYVSLTFPGVSGLRFFYNAVSSIFHSLVLTRAGFNLLFNPFIK